MKGFYYRYKEVINYLIVGGLTTIVSLGVYYLCVLTVLDPYNPLQLQIANIISWIAAVTFAYFTNRKYVFESKDPNILQESIKFFASRGGTLLMDMGTMFLLVTIGGMSDKIAKLIVQVLVTIGNYLFSKLLVFRKYNE
ncbi:MAG: GtrA family protein [Mogibacterium sp.]|nr:GtrA family protein [Mogibacterium sp.]